MSAEPGLMTAIARMVAEGDQRRVRRAADAFASFTPDRQWLIKDAAVMGFVQGLRYAGSVERPPPDGQVVTLVVLSCLQMPDLYPAISRKGRL